MAIPIAIIAASAHQQRHRPHHRRAYAPRHYQQPVYYPRHKKYMSHGGYRDNGYAGNGRLKQRSGSEHRSGYHREFRSHEQLRITTKRVLRGPPEPVLRSGDMHRVKAAFENF